MFKKQLASYPANEVQTVHFFQLVRSIEREFGVQVGSDLRPQDEPVHFRADLDAQFPSNEIANWNGSSDPPEVYVSFFGLFGASGALPHHYTELMADRARIKDFALRDFLDMFNHRLLSFFYRCWEKHQFPIAYETSRAAGREDRVTGALRSLTGLRTDGLWDRLSFQSRDLLYFSGHLANRRPSRDALCSMLATAFNLPVRVEQFVGQLMFIEPSEQTRIGSPPLGYSLGNQLGNEAIAGQWIWDFENKFRVQLGPVSYQTFLEFNPGLTKLRKLWDHVRIYVGPQFDFDVQLILMRDQVPMTQLGAEGSARLGWNTWIGDWKKPHHAEDAIFQLSETSSISSELK
jgi:type VI secretion system protein ImpH